MYSPPSSQNDLFKMVSQKIFFCSKLFIPLRMNAQVLCMECSRTDSLRKGCLNSNLKEAREEPHKYLEEEHSWQKEEQVPFCPQLLLPSPSITLLQVHLASSQFHKHTMHIPTSGPFPLTLLGLEYSSPGIFMGPFLISCRSLLNVTFLGNVSSNRNLDLMPDPPSQLFKSAILITKT